MQAPLFECRNLVKRYGDQCVVDDLSFAIAPGECLGMVFKTRAVRGVAFAG